MHQTVNVGGEPPALGETVTSNRIVVGVDGSPGARSALLWAADECRVRGQMLLVVHAPDLADTVAVNHADEPAVRYLDEVGERMLSEHAAAASARQPNIVGTHGRGGIISSILGSVSYRVAAHAHCPVAVVPERRMPRRDARAPRVVVGISPTTSGRFALEFAFDEAQRRAATLVAVQASGTPGSAERLEFAASATRYRNVPLEPLLVDAEPSDALLQAAQDAQLVVVGCHHSEDRWSTRLGPVPSTIMHRSPCPVVVVGELHPASSAEHGGALAVDFA